MVGPPGPRQTAEVDPTEGASLRAREPGSDPLWASWGLGVAALMDAHPRAVDAVLGPMAREVERHGVLDAFTPIFLADEIEALLALGQTERATRLCDALESYARACEDRWPLVAALRCRALLLAATQQPVEALRVAEEAMAACDGLGMTLEVARTCLVAGRLARRSKQKRRARDRLEKAAALFEQAGCLALRDLAVAELARVAPPVVPCDEDVLTATETQVAQLSAFGHTNREVAASLGISPKTVEVNLSRIYHKLGIHSRAELGALVGRRTPLAAPLPEWGNP